MHVDALRGNESKHVFGRSAELDARPGSPARNERDDIKVVVYRNISLDEVKRMYPVIKEKQDYRYLEYQAALDLLKAYEQDPFWNEYKETKDRARQTKRKSLRSLVRV